MSFSRREFLLGFGAGLLLPKNWDFYAGYLARTGEPYLAVPKSARHTLFVKNCDDEEGPGYCSILKTTTRACPTSRT
jgi:hypothetical protein